jgi:hypothetical protein
LFSYIVSCSNAIFPSPADFVLFGVQYLFYMILDYLGSDVYECCFLSESATGDGTLVVCRSSIRHRIAAIETQPLTRLMKPTDPDWLKRAQYASMAHKEVLLSFKEMLC